MKYFYVLIIIFFTNNLSAEDKLDSWDLYKTIESSTVRINIWENFDTENEATITGGTGIVINKFDNFYYLLTNSHVVLEIYCSGFYEEGCEDKEWSEEYTIVVDHPDFEYEYVVENSDLIYWYEFDLAVIALDLIDNTDELTPIEIGGAWHPLMDIYGAGFPAVLGNYGRDYADMVFCSGVVNTMFSDDEALYQLGNYTIAHSCTLAGGMSGGPLVDGYGLLLGVNGLSGNSELYRNQDGIIEDLDIAPANFNYAVDIWDLYRLEIAEDDGHFDPDSLFYNYLPKLSYDYHDDFYESYVELYPDKIDKIKLLFE